MGFEKWSYVKYFMFVYSGPILKDATKFLNLKKNNKLDQKDNGRVLEKLLKTNNENGLKRYNNIYVHIPFCMSICEYCMWYKIGYNRTKMENYLNALYKEMDMTNNSKYVKSTKFDSVYIGGGTPSTLSVGDIKKLFNKLQESFYLTDDCEITFESNTATLTKEKIETLKKSGVTRISLGIQTFDEKRLGDMECAHKVNQARDIIAFVLETGLTLNLDLIYGYKDQKESQFRKDLDELCKISPQQVTLYPLRVVSGTKLYTKIVKEGGLNYEAHENKLIKFKTIADEVLTANKYNKGEFDFSYYKQNCESIRHIAFETRDISLGASAAMYSDIGETRNVSDVDKYIQLINENKFPIVGEVYLTKQQIYEKFIFMRIIYANKSIEDFVGATKVRFKEFFGADMSEDLFDKVRVEMEKYDLIKIENKDIKITTRMWKYIENATVLY